MNIKKSMISIAAATVLITGMSGCGDSTSTSNDTSVTDATNSGTKITNPKGTVTGLVQDTNGNPLAGVVVYLADMTTTTNAGGLYTFNDVSVTNTVGADAATANNILSLTIAAPAGYIGATVRVSPSAQLDSAEGATTTSGTETFIDGYMAQAGTAVLPALNSSVTGVLRDFATGAVIANTEIVLDFTNGGTAAATAQEQAQDGVATTYAVSTYRATTDANGAYSFESIPSDSTFTAYVPGYALTAGTPVIGFNTDAETALTLADSTVTKIVSSDTIAPLIASVAGSINSVAKTSTTANTAANLLMLEDDTRQIITLNFTESIANLSQNNENATKSVTVYDWTNSTYIDLSAADAVVISGNTLTLTLPNALTDAQEIDVNLLITDFKDDAGNKLVITDALAPAGIDDNLNYIADTSGLGQAVRVSLIAYNDLNTNAISVTAQAQQEKDTVGTSADGFDAQRAYSNAFNDTSLPTANIAQLNADESAARLTRLSAAQAITATVTANTARFTFTPSGAASYNVDVKNAAGVAVAPVLDVNRVSVAAAPVLTGTTLNVVSDTTVTPVELVLTAANMGDVITITPLDDFGYTGTPVTIALVDNVAPTTVLQESYMNAQSVSAAAGVVSQFGDGGELTNNFGQAAGAGTPILALTPGLLDNLDAAGNNILSDNTFATGDQTLLRELEVHNGKNTATPPARVITQATVYDATAYPVFAANLSRKIGVAFSEDVNLSGVTPSYNGSDITAGSYVAINDVTVDDAGVAATGSAVGTEAGLGANVDLVEFATTNVLDLANNNHGKVLSFDGIKDNSGNVADNADVVLSDNMPPFVTKSTYDGDLVLVFNEAITTPTTAVPVTINVRNLTNTKSTNLTLTDLNKVTGTTSNWSLSTDGKTLTIGSPIIALSPIAGGVLGDTLSTLFDAGSYIESAVSGDTVSRQHAIVTFANVQDTAAGKTNSWSEWTTLATQDIGDAKFDLVMPSFAAIDMIGEFKFDTTATKFKIGTALNTTQEVVWTFTHPIKVDIAGNPLVTDVFFDVNDAGVTLSGVTNIITATEAAISSAWVNAIGTVDAYSETLGGVVYDSTILGYDGFEASSIDDANTQMTLSSDRKTVTLSFRSTNIGNVAAGDTLKFEGTTATKTAFKSSLTNDEVLSVTASSKI